MFIGELCTFGYSNRVRLQAEKSHENPNLGGPINLAGQSLWDLFSGSNSVSQVDGVSDMTAAC